jgi:hypothetical protein
MWGSDWNAEYEFRNSGIEELKKSNLGIVDLGI